MLLEQRKIQGHYAGNSFAADGLFGDLPPKALESLARVKRNKRIPKGVVLFARGEMPRGIYMLVKGAAQLTANAELNNSHIVRSVEPNEVLGLTETIAGLPYKLLVKTNSPCVFEFIERQDFIQFLRREPDVCFRLLRMLGLNLQKTYRFRCSSVTLDTYSEGRDFL